MNTSFSGILGLALLAAFAPAVSAASLLDIEAEQDPDGYLGLRVLSSEAAPAFWRIYETSPAGDGGRLQFFVPDTRPPEPQAPTCWSLFVEATDPEFLEALRPSFASGTRAASVPTDASLGWAPSLSFHQDTSELRGFTVTFRFDGCDPADPNEHVDIDAQGLFFELRRTDTDPVPLDLVFGQIYGAVYQGTQLIGSGFDAFEVPVTIIPEPSVAALLLGGVVVLFSRRRSQESKPSRSPAFVRTHAP